MFVSIDDEGTRPAELARRLAITRQSMQQLLERLVENELVTIDVDPSDGRATIVRLAPRAPVLARDVGVVSAQIESHLSERIGADALAQLRAALELDWGESPVVGVPANSSQRNMSQMSEPIPLRIG